MEHHGINQIVNYLSTVEPINKEDVKTLDKPIVAICLENFIICNSLYYRVCYNQTLRCCYINSNLKLEQNV